jgi:hypothetical protein
MKILKDDVAIARLVVFEGGDAALETSTFISSRRNFLGSGDVGCQDGGKAYKC